VPAASFSTCSVFAPMPRDRQTVSVERMRWFLVDISVPDPDRMDLERATRTLRAAQGRLFTSASRLRPLIAGVITEGGRLVCLIEAPSIPAVRRLVALALLPGGRIREVRRGDSLTLQTAEGRRTLPGDGQALDDGSVEQEAADPIASFVDELAMRGDVEAVILFGSRARGNPRPNSDADLLVIVPDGYRRGTERREQQAFELMFLGESIAAGLLTGNPDMAAELGSSARLLFDRRGAGARVLGVARGVLEQGKQALEPDVLESSRFNSQDQLEAAQWLRSTDLSGAELVLQHKVEELSATFFDVRRMWTPGVKLRMPAIREADPTAGDLFTAFYGHEASFERRLELASQLLPVVYGF
jgi:hypothetical protein